MQRCARMVLNAILLIGGLLLAGLTLRDVFETVVVPGGSTSFLHTARRLVFLLLPLWRRIRGPRRGLSVTFAPLVLVSSFVLWMVLLAIGFGAIAFAVRASFQPELHTFGQAVYIIGSSLVTVGLSETNATGWARWIVLAAGFCGLAVMTMAITYLLEVQSSIARRDTGIIKLKTSAGEPPSAVTLLERFAAIGTTGDLPGLLSETRDWCATVRQSHSNHPSLIYFQSHGSSSGWPAALGALLDLSLIAELILDDDRLGGRAILLGEEALQMARELAQIVGLPADEPASTAAELGSVIERLAGAGFAVKNPIDCEHIARRRNERQKWVEPMAEHLGKPSTTWLPGSG